MAYERKARSFAVRPVLIKSFAHIARCKGRPDSKLWCRFIEKISKEGGLTLSAGREPQPLRSVLSMLPPLTHRGLPAAFNIHNDEMKGAMGMRLGNPLARNWFCRKANAANGMFGRHDISAITRLPSMSDLVADL
ncbi:MAG: hypothetical protein V2I43_09085 [Parvularcula sp.]|jgi:hypothetical protein|nr:hypothetical protein [Parvularcula sp.]